MDGYLNSYLGYAKFNRRMLSPKYLISLDLFVLGVNMKKKKTTIGATMDQ